MKFQRNARIVRGQLEAAPFAGVFFLLTLFLLIHSSIVFTPGIRVGLPENGNDFMIRASTDGKFHFRKASIREPALLRELEGLRKELTGRTLVVFLEPGVSSDALVTLQEKARNIGITLAIRKAGIELPEAENLPGTQNPAVAVAVSNTGQYFLENQVIELSALADRLRVIRQKVAGPFTLILQADKDASYQSIIGISQIATAAGIDELLLATRPPFKPGLTSEKNE